MFRKTLSYPPAPDAPWQHRVVRLRRCVLHRGLLRDEVEDDGGGGGGGVGEDEGH